jgi:adenosylmethionine-8-amino-7-oxononanoate aminotransferase
MRDVWDTDALRAADRSHLWHPFTPMQEWCAGDPLVLARGRGAMLCDTEGRWYLDGNSSIWTNIHGHNHPVLNAALRAQLEQVAHVSFLGTTHEPAIRLAHKLVSNFPPDSLTRVFFSDDGSTALEAAMKMAVQFRQLQGEPLRTGFVAFDGAYHGDTLGAASLGGIGLFHRPLEGHRFPVWRVPSVEALRRTLRENAGRIGAVVLEPLIQGAAGMRPWPAGMLRELRQVCDREDVFLILDEVMTGFGRTGRLFACQHEDVVPDFLCLAKGLTGGYLPLAATLTTRRVFEAFLGPVEAGRTFYYGHSYSGNPLGCAVALASLEIFETERVLERLQPLIAHLDHRLSSLHDLPQVHEIRRCGFVAGIELRHPGGEAFDWSERVGARVCMAARGHGLLTRPILDTIVFMPPLCVTGSQIDAGVEALALAIREVLG